MTETPFGSQTVINLEAAQTALRKHFLGWQCRLRQLSIRQAGGRPSVGMRPTLRLPSIEPQAITVVLIKAQSSDSTAQFRHLVRKTQDPADRYDAALKFMAAAYYQHPLEFSDNMTALFGPGSELVQKLLKAGVCRLDFEQYKQRYYIPCKVSLLAEQEPAYQATYWHNRSFNPNLPDGVQIIEFQPDWARAEAEPSII